MEYREISSQRRFVRRATPATYVSHQGRASNPFAQANSARDWGACVLDQSAQSSALGGRTSTPAIYRSARLLGQVGGPCDLASDVYISPFLRGSDGPRGALSVHRV